MTTPTVHPEYEPLLCSSIVYRALRSNSWVDKAKGDVRSAAYIRRPVDTEGLSVEPAATIKIEEVGSRLNKCYGVVSLHVGHVRDTGLDVKQDSAKHANIVGVPYQEQDPAESERLAGLLAKQSRIQRLV